MCENSCMVLVLIPQGMPVPQGLVKPMGVQVRPQLASAHFAGKHARK